MQIKSIADIAILSTFIKLPFSIKTFVLSIFKQPLKTGFTAPYMKSAVAQRLRVRLGIKVSQVLDSPEALCCVLEQDTSSSA